MTNYEFNKKFIDEHPYVKFAVTKDGKLTVCQFGFCDKCLLKDGEGLCSDRKLIKFLMSEHVEPVTLTPFEHQICENLYKHGYLYMARDINAVTYQLYASKCIPLKIDGVYDSGYSDTQRLDKALLNDNSFKFITGEEPWKMEDLLKLEIRND